MIKQNMFEEPIKDVPPELCTLCGTTNPWDCEYCMGAMAVPPYMAQQQDTRLWIGSGEDVCLD